jgi:hypothetical protein
MKLAQKKRINLDVAFIAWKAVSFFLNIYHFFFWGFEYFFIRFVQVHQRLEELRKTLVVTINIVSIVGSEKRIRETETESLDFFLEKDREFGWYLEEMKPIGFFEIYIGNQNNKYLFSKSKII